MVVGTSSVGELPEANCAPRGPYLGRPAERRQPRRTKRLSNRTYEPVRSRTLAPERRRERLAYAATGAATRRDAATLSIPSR
jgi:hypothetical protein